MSWLGAEIPGKRLELLKETVPQSARIAVLVNPDSLGHGPQMHNLHVAAQTLGLHLQVLALRRAEELEAAFAAMTREGADALFVSVDPLVIEPLRGRIADLAATHRLPTMYGWRTSVDAGGLMSYGPNLFDVQRRAATYVDKILSNYLGCRAVAKSVSGSL